MGSGSTEVLVDAGSFVLYKDGHVDRLACMDTVPTGFDAGTGVMSRDVVIDAATGVAVRVYVPADIQVDEPDEGATAGAATTKKKLPIVVFFHGGYFIVGSAGEPGHHRFVSSLVARARVVAVSVDYRLAPEHPLPAAYDDSWAALSWAVSGAADPWLSKHGDLGRAFLAGVSAGGNIAHNMTIAAGAGGLHAAAAPARIEGAILLHPSFSGEQKMEAEAEEYWASVKKRWTVIFPGARGGLDDPRMNPLAAGAPSLRERRSGSAARLARREASAWKSGSGAGEGSARKRESAEAGVGAPRMAWSATTWSSGGSGGNGGEEEEGERRRRRNESMRRARRR